ncbi:MAG: choice-of-anchor L domain-containing protein [Thiothrix sp.]|uniref:choice-of-anchor L domain-containing protein n=1 Tax=Thiothrix sp. TaxID=1032 RepID=UPI0026307E27|nr:choice-of-anchor L domain-containing protein [Thiothrix sp.]MDD5393101.1 choice-of-anchor L domain-containing protein [Thiothrix sp.]
MKIITTITAKPFLFLIACLLYSTGMSAYAALSFNAGSTAAEMGAVLDGPGLSVSNFQVTKGINQQYGIMTGGKATLGFETGVFLNTGNIGSLQGPNNSGSYYYRTGVVYADPDLKKISTYAKYDPIILEFDIVPLGDRANFVFTFGSEEYPEFVCSQFNDAFGLFISGPGLVGTQNAAFLPASTTPIAVNNINGGVKGSSADGTACQLGNTAYFVDNGNGGGSPISQLDGFTKTLTASMGGLLPGNTYHVKLALADAADAGYDSGAAFKWLTSTKSEPVDLSLSASASTSSPSQNSEVELTWTINNASSIATSMAQLGLEWPAGMTWVSDDSGGAYNPVTAEWNADVIPAGGSKSLKVRARVGTDASYQVTGEIIYAFNEDPDSAPLNHNTKPGEDDTAILTLLPIANNAPAITNNSNAATYTVNFTEGSKDTVLNYDATDADGDKEGAGLVWSLTGGEDKSRFTINPADGSLNFTTSPDFEHPLDADKNNTYEVRVSVCDSKGGCTIQALSVAITNVDEDSDGDGIPDSKEVEIGTDPYSSDSDGDGLSDKEEIDTYGTSPIKADTDGDGLSDGDEVNKTDTDPLKADTDGDGLNDAAEVGADLSKPRDTDGDGMIDAKDTDDDGDGLQTRNENYNGGTPLDDDTDKDGIPDYRDTDDDGDSIATRFETPDPNTDGSPADARDSDKDGTPDYRDTDDDGDGKATVDEQPDVNNDSNPADAVDSDDDGTPNYLDNYDEPGVRVTTRVFFQGNFNLATKRMSDDLRKLGYLPKLQPYGTLLASFGYSNVENIPPFNYPGTETATDAMLATTGDDAPVDWVLVELRDASDPKIRVAAKAGLVQRDGDIISAPSGSPSLAFNGIADGNYYVAVRHRNHIGVMSAASLHLTHEPISLDFTDPTTPTYGIDQRLTDGVTALLWGGDANNSNSSIAVGPGSDANVILGAILIAPGNVLTNTYYRLGGYYASDLNLDGYTLFSGPNNDINILLGNVLLHPGNTSFSSNYVLNGAIPR